MFGAGASFSADKAASRWDALTGPQVRTILDHADFIEAVAGKARPPNTLLVFIGSHGITLVRRFDLTPHDHQPSGRGRGLRAGS